LRYAGEVAAVLAVLKVASTRVKNT
jgi:hypothetical protein